MIVKEIVVKKKEDRGGLKVKWLCDWRRIKKEVKERFFNGGNWQMREGQHEAKREEKVTLGFCTGGYVFVRLRIMTCGNSNP